MEGLIVKSTGSWYDIKAGTTYLKGRLRGKFRNKGLKTTNPLAVGDVVTCEWEDQAANTVIITDIIERTNYFIRKSTRASAQYHIVASNIDQALLVCTLRKPRTPLGFIDRFLVNTESFRIPTQLIFNKTDILSAQQHDKLDQLIATYEKIGYPCHKISVTEQEGLEGLSALLKGKTTLTSGHSGVGKSSLLNYLNPSLALATDDISHQTEKGRHTTTYAQMHFMDHDTAVIDTPGIKEIGLVNMEKEEISHYFPEMRSFINECKFHNCTHTHEPGCAVKNAVAEGYIPESRYVNYMHMLEDEEVH